MSTAKWQNIAGPKSSLVQRRLARCTDLADTRFWIGSKNTWDTQIFTKSLTNIVFTGFDDPIQLNCGESNKNYTVGWTETTATVLMPEIRIEKGDDIYVWACKGDSCDPTSFSCYDSNQIFVKDLPNKKKLWSWS